MNQRARLKRQNAARAPRQFAAIVFAENVNAFLELLPQWRAGLEQIGIAAEAAAVSMRRLSGVWK